MTRPYKEYLMLRSKMLESDRLLPEERAALSELLDSLYAVAIGGYLRGCVDRKSAAYIGAVDTAREGLRKAWTLLGGSPPMEAPC